MLDQYNIIFNFDFVVELVLSQCKLRGQNKNHINDVFTLLEYKLKI